MDDLTHTSASWPDRADRASFYGFTDLPSLKARGAVVLSHGEGPYVFGTDGRRWLDANSGLWNMVAGFNHPGITEAAQVQYARFPGYHALFGRMSDQTVALAEKMAELAPFGGGRVFFTNSGSEANDTLIKMLWFLARAEGQPQRRKILTRINAYHGVTLGAASMTGKSYIESFGLPLDGFIHLTCPHHWREGRPDESEAAFTQRLGHELEAVISREGAETIAGFVAEPVMGAGGVIPPSRGYFQTIQPILKRHGIPLIADEVICGFGRTGKLWGAESLGFTPDALIASKAMTAGYFPMGAVVLGADLARRLTDASVAFDEFPHGFTASGHPVGCAIALKAIDVILNEGLLEQVGALTPSFEAGLAALADRHPQIGEVRNIGLMAALEVVADRKNKSPYPSALSVSERIANTCMDHGLICRPLGQAIVLCPPYILTNAQMSELFDRLDRALTEVFAGLPSG
ncbi:MAG: aminotransferase class III-fold pyridoxal phosphate-dependent enzyme [Pseudomonadota bacterium]